ncbi:MAG: hypothetical protein ACKO5E_10325, partial [bacterium]
MRQKYVTFLVSSLLLTYLSSTSAVEYLVTDVGGNVIDNSNPLTLGNDPSPKTIRLWMTYNDTERTATNANGGGLMGGGARFTSNNSLVAAIIGPNTSAVSNPGNQWVNPLTVQFNSSTPNPPSIMQASFTRGTQSGLVLDPTVGGTGRILLLEVLITPGPNINPTGTQFTIVSPSGAPLSYGSSAQQYYYGAAPPLGQSIGI